MSTTLLTPIIIPSDLGFSPAQTFGCGQAFRWRETENHSYIGVVQGLVCEIAQTPQGLELRHISHEQYQRVLFHYLDMNRPYAQLQSLFCTDPILAHAVAYASGLRLLRQPPFETLCSFIISQNNNVPRIMGIVERLCEAFGEPLYCHAYPQQTFYAFPTPERLAACSLEDLSPLRAGFRARYLLDAAQKVANGTVTLEDLESMPLEDARAVLTSITGVGVKVADCTLLFAYSRMDAFPLDVWMKRVMACWYPKGLPPALAPHAGLAQQYLFHYARTCKDFPPEIPCLRMEEKSPKTKKAAPTRKKTSG